MRMRLVVLLMVHTSSLKTTRSHSTLAFFGAFWTCTTYVRRPLPSYTGADSEHCIDYVLVRCDMLEDCITSSSVTDLDLGHEGDHHPIALELHWKAHWRLTAKRQPGGGSYQREDISHDRLALRLSHYQPPSWGTNIEEQNRHLNDYLHAQLRQQCPLQPTAPKKSCISELTWQTRATRIRQKKRLQDLNRRLNLELYYKCFLGWAGRQKGDATENTAL